MSISDSNPFLSAPGRKSHLYQEIASREGEPRRSTEARGKVRKKRAKKKTKKAINSCGKN
jgi:hypothetical protein